MVNKVANTMVIGLHEFKLDTPVIHTSKSAYAPKTV